VIVPAPLRRQRARRNRQNCLLLAVDVKSLPATDGSAEILAPGARGRRIGAERAATGIRLASTVWRELTEVATALDVPVPASPG
jgi:LDH2 family malate/lactate/ureidoglycolate dehydrogenase